MDAALTPEAARLTVLWGGLAIALVLGAVAQASRFCTMGALADWFTFRGPARLMMWLVAIAVAMVGTQGLISAQFFDATRMLPWSPRLVWLSCLVGGFLFGWGMVLASGCPQRNLVRAGAGSLKSVVTLIVAGVAAQMTLRGLFAEGRTRWLDSADVTLNSPQDVGSLLAPVLGASAGTLRWVVTAGVLLLLAAVVWRHRKSMERMHWISGLVIGALVPLCWALTGHWGFIPEHPETLEPAYMGTQSRAPEALSFTSPLAQTLNLLTLWSDKSLTLTFGIVLAAGVLLGSMAMALARKEFRLESFTTKDDLQRHLIGAVMMGFGGITALGCSVGQGLTGVATLSLGSALALTGIVSGTRMALWRQEQRIACDG